MLGSTAVTFSTLPRTFPEPARMPETAATPGKLATRGAVQSILLFRTVQSQEEDAVLNRNNNVLRHRISQENRGLAAGVLCR